MRTAIMQPYFLPYLGYFQLIACVDRFIVYDNIKYTKKGWINRNRLLLNGQAVPFSVPLKSASDSLDVRERELADSFNRDKLLNQIRAAYRAAPRFSDVFPAIEEIVRHEESNLFGFIHHSLTVICERLGIATPITISSQVPVDDGLRHQDRVLALCEAVGTDVYVNAIGGLDLYSREAFRARGIELRFIRSRPFSYRQFDHDFVPGLSIIDVMMFNPRDVVRECLTSNFDLI